MNVTELARRLRVHPKELLRLLPEYGFDIGMKAVKIDNKVAQKIMRAWPRIKADLRRKEKEEAEERKRQERALRKEQGVTVYIPNILTVKEFAAALNLPVTQIITELMKNGILANQNQNIDYDTASIMGEELGFDVERKEEAVDIEEETTQDSELEEALAQAKTLEQRAPVIVVMGHVDHGKTKLLDTVREANIIDTESGGITQHIGAYQTVWKDPKNKHDRALTFIDTPGHEAFTVMRSRGAVVADVAILVVAADDGVKPQTKEAAQIIKAAKLPIVVAINKIDKPDVDIQRVKTELSKLDLIPEEWGGSTPMVEISAKQKLNIDKLLDMLLLVADVNEADIQADPHLPAVGTVIESHVDKHMGPVATVLIQAGTLRKGEPLVVGNEIYGKARALRNYRGENMDEAGPSVPAQIIGFKVAPHVGDILNLANKATAKKINVKEKKSQQTGAEQHQILDYGGDEDKKKYLNVLIRADVLGSLEAILASLAKVQHEDVGIKVIGKGLGNITEDDVLKAETAGAHVLGFHVTPTTTTQELLREKHVNFHRFDVIYHLLDWVNEELEKLLEYEIIITELGKMEVRGIFLTEKNAMIVGGLVIEGKIEPKSKARVIRNGELIGEGKVATCQIAQDTVKKIPGGSEGGIRFEGKLRIEKGDILEVYSEEKKVRKLSDS